MNAENRKGVMLMKKVAKIFAVFVFVLAFSVFPSNSASAQTGFYVGVFGGYAFSPDASLSYTYYDYYYYYNREYDVEVQDSAVFGFKFGYTPPRLKFLSFEFEYSYLNPDVDRTALPYDPSSFAIAEGDIKLNNFMFNAIFKYPEGKFHPYIGLGIGFSYIDWSLTTTSPVRSISNDDTVFAWQMLAGVEIDLTNNLSVDIGYRFFATESSSDDDYYDYYDNDTRLEYRTSMVTLGLKYKF